MIIAFAARLAPVSPIRSAPGAASSTTAVIAVWASPTMTTRSIAPAPITRRIAASVAHVIVGPPIATVRGPRSVWASADAPLCSSARIVSRPASCCAALRAVPTSTTSTPLSAIASATASAAALSGPGRSSGVVAKTAMRIPARYAKATFWARAQNVAFDEETTTAGGPNRSSSHPPSTSRGKCSRT